MIRKVAAAALAVFSIMACRESRDQPAAREAPSITREVDAYLQPFLDAGGFSGAVLMDKGGRVLVDKGFGLASQEFGIPNTPRTKFQIASLSKTFTSAAIMMLEERGQLSVRDPLTRFIPDYPAGDKIMIHHLLTHTSGIPNVNNFPEYDRESRFPHTLLQVIAMFRDKPLRFPPGDRYDYSNSNYNLLAFVIEKVSGLSYGDFLERNIFGPLGMKDTAHRGSDGVIVPLLATGYAPSGAWGLEKAPFLDWTIKTGNGSLYSTVDDLYKWDRALHDGKILSRHSLDAMFTDHASGMGYAWFVENARDGGRSASTDGAPATRRTSNGISTTTPASLSSATITRRSPTPPSTACGASSSVSRTPRSSWIRNSRRTRLFSKHWRGVISSGRIIIGRTPWSRSRWRPEI